MAVTVLSLAQMYNACMLAMDSTAHNASHDVSKMTSQGLPTILHAAIMAHAYTITKLSGG